MIIRRLSHALFGIELLLLSFASVAADESSDDTAPPQYAIEIVIFQYLNPDDGGEGHTSAANEPDFSGIRSLDSIPELVPLDPDERKLGGEAYTFRRGANYRLLLHEGWRQALKDRSNAERVYVRYPEADKRSTLTTIPGLSFIQSDEEVPVMEGTIQVALERYLHLTVDLVYRPDPSASTTYHSDIHLDPASPYEAAEVLHPVYRLKETRRMRRDETHYLDHPQIGVIALIRRYEVPEAESPADSDPESTPPVMPTAPSQ